MLILLLYIRIVYFVVIQALEAYLLRARTQRSDNTFKKQIIMSLVIVSKALFCLLVLALIHIHVADSIPHPPVKIHIVNKLPKGSPHPLVVRCGGTGLNSGNRTLHVNDDYHWEFVYDDGEAQVFDCFFYWGSKSNYFSLFDGFMAPVDIYYWEVKEDGFYVGLHMPPLSPLELVKDHSWSDPAGTSLRGFYPDASPPSAKSMGKYSSLLHPSSDGN